MAREKVIDFSALEKKWQRKWESAGIFRAREKKNAKKFYILEMYPYPSGSGLHMGHAFNYTIGDVYARFKKMNGFCVLHPMGYDSFGLPAENAAVKAKSHPKKFTEDAIRNFMKQQKALGLSYDWSRMIESHKPEYYKWDQWIFLKMFERGLAYRKKAPVNYCGKCKTVLANEQVVNGKCWRHEDSDVEIRHLEQWFLKITDYADELNSYLDRLDGWPETIRAMQKNWIGKSSGTEVDFFIDGKKWSVFTTRADTLFGVTFLVVSAQHPDLMSLVTPEQKNKVEMFLKKLRSVSEEDIVKLDKEGIFSGSYAEHPLTGEKIPVWIGNFVVADYGSGMVMGVPAHDQRDFEFAKKYNLEIKQVITIDEKRNKLSELLEEEFEKFLRHANKNNKKPIIVGGFASRLIYGKPYRNHKDIDIFIDAKDFDFWKEYFVSNGYQDYREEGDVKRDYSKYALYIKEIDGVDVEFDVWVVKTNKKGNFVDFEFVNERETTIKKEHIIEIKYRGLLVNVSKERGLLLDPNQNLKRAVDNCFTGISAYEGYGILINSEGFDGLKSGEAREHITNALEMRKKGRKKIAFKLRDWLISRQRFWGAPIPVIYCDSCGVVPVNEKDLPVKLPENIKFSSAENPLKKYEKFVRVKCHKCGKDARRETDTMDTFIDSSWYFLRYTDSKNSKKIFESRKANYWMPIDFYIGGKEHATGHLIYFRFVTKFLRDLGLLKFDEPALRFFNQGMLHGPDGRKMSKSYGNVILPESVSKKYGMDSARLFLVSVASPDKDIDWSDKGIEGSARFVLRVMNYCFGFKDGKTNTRMAHKLNKTIKNVSDYIEGLRYNLAVISLRECFGVIEEEGISREDLKKFVKMLSVFAPHVSEEIWSKLGGKGFVSASAWPEADEKKIDEKLEKAERSFEKAVEDIRNVLRIVESRGKKAGKVYVYVLPNELGNYDSIKLGERLGVSTKVYAVNDSKKYDPEGKSKKVKPGRPGIYVE